MLQKRTQLSNWKRQRTRKKNTNKSKVSGSNAEFQDWTRSARRGLTQMCAPHARLPALFALHRSREPCTYYPSKSSIFIARGQLALWDIRMRVRPIRIRPASDVLASRLACLVQASRHVKNALPYLSTCSKHAPWAYISTWLLQVSMLNLSTCLPICVLTVSIHTLVCPSHPQALNIRPHA